MKKVNTSVFAWALLFFTGLFSPTRAQKFDPAMFWEARNFSVPTNTQPLALGNGNPSATLKVFDEETALVLPTQFGVNSNFRSGDGLVGRSGLYSGFGSFRYPAGSGSDQYFWDCNVPNAFLTSFTAYCGTASQFMDPDHFIEFREKAQGEGSIVVNYGYARYGVVSPDTREARVAQAADYAAEFVRYMNVTKQAGIRFWEVGNENYGPWEEGYDVNGNIITGTEYGEDFLVFYQKMKAVDPDILIGAVLWHKEEEDWNGQVLAQVGNVADFLIVHHYFNVEDLGSMKDAIDEIRSDMDEIQTKAAQHSNVPLGKFPVAFTEFNIHDDPNTNMLNGQFMAEALGTMVEEGFFLNMAWVNEWRINGNDSKGIIAFDDPNQPDYTPRPSYTAFYFYDKYFGDKMLRSEVTGNNNVRAYSSRFSNGDLGLVALNYSNTPKALRVESPLFGTEEMNLYMHSVHAPDVNFGTKKFYVNGQTGTTPSGGPNLPSVAAYAATYTSDKTIQLPPHSVSYMGLQKKTSSLNPIAAQSIEVFPNPTADVLFLRGLSLDWAFAYDALGRKYTLNTSASTSLQVNHLPEGLYLLFGGADGRLYRGVFLKK